MWSQIIALLRAVPVTWLMLFAAGLILGADNAVAWKMEVLFHVAQIQLGAENVYQLWDGAWWTVITTGFHHGGFFHLLCNASFLWWAGRLLETRMGSWRYALFSLGGLIFSGAAQSLWGPYVGLSGMLCAQFGLMWAWRRTDPWLQTYVRQEQIQGILWMLLLGLPLAWLQILPIGNVCHFSGLAYGYLAGLVYTGSLRQRQWRPVFLVGHAILIPWFYLLVHPFWSGEYHWHRGDVAKSPQERLRHYKQAVTLEPDLSGPWYNLALISYQEGQIADSWNWVLQGLRLHPSYQESIELARHLWGEFISPRDQIAARQRLHEIFGEAAAQWEKTLNMEVADLPLPGPVKKLQGRPAGAIEAGEAIEIPQPPFTLPPRALDEIPRPARKIPAPNPNAPGSAEEGRAA